MCGIAGFNWEDKNLIKKMSSALSHRGPDQHSFYTDKNISFGHRRLSIIDLSEKGKQPMISKDGRYVLIYNGEIYNFKEIRQELEKKYNHTFTSNTDSEVIIYAYHEFGKACVKRFNGFFAFAIWDTHKKELFLARDRIGIKPLYYYSQDNAFIFSSEIKAILAHPLPRAVDPAAFNTFLHFRFVTGEKTMFKDIFRLLPGHTLILKEKKINIEKYWDVKEAIQKKPISHSSQKLQQLLRESVHMRLMSDVPLGVYLSGGIDSTTMVSLMKEKTDNIKTFSVGFGNNVDNELNYAKQVADHFATDHHEVTVEDKHLKVLPKMVYHLEEPIGDAATLPTYVLSEFTKKKVTVVLAGEGADEQFAGYDRYKMMIYGNHLAKITPAFVKHKMIGKLKTNNHIIARVKELITSKGLDEKYMKAVGLFSSKEVKELQDSLKNKNLDKTDSKNAVQNILQKQLLNNGMQHMLNKILYFDQKTVLPDDFLMKADKMTMAHSLEERVPFLDHRIVEFSFTVPPRQKLRGFNGKYVLKKAMEGIIPKPIIKRKKRGYNAPMDYWLKGELKTHMQQILEQSNHMLYDKRKMLQMLDDFQTSGNNYKKNWFQSQKLWSMLIFELWHKQFIEEEKIIL